MSNVLCVGFKRCKKQFIESIPSIIKCNQIRIIKKYSIEILLLLLLLFVEMS